MPQVPQDPPSAARVLIESETGPGVLPDSLSFTPHPLVLTLVDTSEGTQAMGRGRETTMIQRSTHCGTAI